MKKAKRRGLTLIELLIVVAIIALLFQLSLPAIESARESARQTHCKNNIRQLALGCQMHTDAHGHFPTGGWTYAWVGDPNRGFSKKQPGGWGYNILPYIEQQELHDVGAGLGEGQRRKAAAQMYGTAVPVFVCTSRRAARPQPFIKPHKIMNANLRELARRDKAGCSDYAANMGNLLPEEGYGIGPGSYEEGDQWENGDDPKKSWVAAQNNGITGADIPYIAHYLLHIDILCLFPAHYQCKSTDSPPLLA